MRKNRAIACLLIAIFPGVTRVHAQVQYEGKGLRDPFTDSADTAAPKSGSDIDAGLTMAGLHLDGVIYGTEHPRAIISGKILGVGDKFGAWKVVRMEKDGVVLLVNGKELVLKQTSIKQTSRKAIL